jgi:hypothetical protein
VTILNFVSKFEITSGNAERNRGGGGEPVEKIEPDGREIPFGKLLAAPSLPYDPGSTDCRDRFRCLLISKESTDLIPARSGDLATLMARKYEDEDVYNGCTLAAGRVPIDQVHLGTMDVKTLSEMYVLFSGLQVQYRKQQHPSAPKKFVAIKSVVADKTYLADHDFENVGGWLADFKLATELKQDLERAKKDVERSSHELRHQTRARLLLGSSSEEAWASSGKENDRPIGILVEDGKIKRATGLWELKGDGEVQIGYVIGMPAISKKKVVVEKPEDYQYGGRDWFEKIVFWPAGKNMPIDDSSLMTKVFQLLQGAYQDDITSRGCSAKSRNVKVSSIDLELGLPMEQPYGEEAVKAGDLIWGFYALIADAKVFNSTNKHLANPEDWTPENVAYVVANKIWISKEAIDENLTWIEDEALKTSVKSQDELMSKLCNLFLSQEDPPLLGWV